MQLAHLQSASGAETEMEGNGMGVISDGDSEGILQRWVR